MLRTILSVTLGLGTLIILSSAPAVSQGAATRPDACPVDDAFWNARFAPASRIELLVAAGNTVPADPRVRTLYGRLAAAVIDCVPPGTRADVYPITDFGVGRGPVFAGTAPRATSNTLLDQRDREAFARSSEERIDGILGVRRAYTGSDPLGTLYTVGESVHAAPASGPALIVLVTNGWQQTPTLNLFRYNDDPSKHADEIVRRLRREGALPNLSSTAVAFAGVTRGDVHMKMGYREVIGLRRFWNRLITAAGGTLVNFDEALPGIVTPL